MTRPLVFDLPLEALQAWVSAAGEPPYRALQIWQHLYRSLATDPLQLSDMPRPLRLRLQQEFDFSGLEPTAALSSADGKTEKTLYRLRDGQAVEAVWMGYDRRRTVCISTQAGCAMGCSFCATGQMGFGRHLTSGEIVEQVLDSARRLRAQASQLTNIVVMGMGEPFHNYEATMQALDRLNDGRGFGFGARRMTVSTVGIVPMIERFTAENRQINLAISLHAATNDLRDQLLPVNRRYPIETLLHACREYVGRTHRRISFEWALIDGVNDGPQQAQALAALLRGLTCYVNLIPLNPTDGFSGAATSSKAARAFAAVLQAGGIPSTVRQRRGIEIRAGCGQLAAPVIHPPSAADSEPGG
ncbi:MAG: 23S rRNA (adenine(2503)-C(2))-methyltransferase RlmN [Anaerolineales bacterium]|nr:23S rRNA (adenine(2503)-C(2))-methyltransferase RlmN [Anaerolineales bacterium]